jgi:5-methylcytosine-specific restriction endonuclease McrA
VFSRWKPGQQVFERIKVRVRIPDRPRKRFLWRCESCSLLFEKDEIRIDHVNPCGPLRSDEDVLRFLHTLTSEDPTQFQGICIGCHQDKTNQENAARREARKAEQ